MPVAFPPQLKTLLEDSDYEPAIRDYAKRAGQILDDNKHPFFPDYTDHGSDHINRVLKSIVDLVPKAVWDDSKKDSDPRLLCDADAAVIIGATLLHDFAMHIREDGFLELISRNTRFRPLDWFDEEQEGHRADRSWPDLWDDYSREARRFSERQLTNIVGEEEARVYTFSGDLDPAKWTRNDHLIIGEFIRRHHARLAHEIAIYGFPGLTPGAGAGEFPALSETVGEELADLIGLAARSHGMSLRVCHKYLEKSPHHAGALRPMGSAVFYPMSLLRVADYLQIDRKRAPAILLNLRDPQSPISIQEWEKHLAVQHLGPARDDPRAIVVTVSPKVSLPIYLQLRALVSGLQAEMDHATAVLAEQYGARGDEGLDRLMLAKHRIKSNLETPAFRDSLPYVPAATGFSADPNILTLLVEPLYGKEPSVGVRELIQNAVDAVRELEVWCKNHGVDKNTLDLPDQEGDVEVNFIKQDDGSWILRVTDKGIGMTAETIRNYFLRAGVSFRSSAEWAKEFVDDNQKSRVIRSGRFGVGAFAIFLLGNSFKVSTRHANSPDSSGFFLTAAVNSQLIEISSVKHLPVGSTIEVELTEKSAGVLLLEYPICDDKEDNEHFHDLDWYCLDSPRVLIRRCVAEAEELFPQRNVLPNDPEQFHPNWQGIKAEGFDLICWTFMDAPRLVCNGIIISDTPRNAYDHERLEWAYYGFRSPSLNIFEASAHLPLTIQRDQLSDTLPFATSLEREVTLNFVAHGLVCGPVSANTKGLDESIYPLVFANEFQTPDLQWCLTTSSWVPADPWLVSLLKKKSIIAAGYCIRGITIPAFPEVNLNEIMFDDHTLILTNLYAFNVGETADSLTKLCTEGFDCLGSKLLSSTSIVIDESNSRPEIDGLRKAGWVEVKGHNESFEFVFGPTDPRRADCVFKILTIISHKFNTMVAKNSLVGRGALLTYASSLEFERPEAPQSLIAQLWNEFLGPRPIPFDVEARKQMIEEAREKPEMRKHIDQWIALKKIWEETGKRPW